MKKINIGIVGIGRMGKIHLDNIYNHVKDVEVVAIVDKNLEQIRESIGGYKVKYVLDSYEDMLNISEIDTVVISSPTDTHTEYIEMAAKSGKQIFSEKPLDLDLARAKDTLKTVEQANVKLMVAFQRRFDVEFKKIKESVDAGKVGSIHILKITSRDPAPPPIEFIKRSGGLFLDMAIHDFDMARFITGSEVVEVYSRGAALIDDEIGKAGDIDTAVTTLTFQNGAYAVIDNSRKAAYGYDQRLEVFGSEGMIYNDNKIPDTHRYYNKDGVHGSLPMYFFLERYKPSYLEEIKVFFKTLREGSEMPVTGWDAIKAIEIAVAAKRSQEENKPVQI